MGQRDINRVLISANEEGMISGDYVFISIDSDPGMRFHLFLCLESVDLSQEKICCVYQAI